MNSYIFVRPHSIGVCLLLIMLCEVAPSRAMAISDLDATSATPSPTLTSNWGYMHGNAASLTETTSPTFTTNSGYWDETVVRSTMSTTQPESAAHIMVNTAECKVPIRGDVQSFSAMVDQLHPVWTAISGRNESVLLEYLSDSNVHMREAAWRGISNMSVTDRDAMFQAAMRDTLPVRWYALGNHPLTSQQLRHLEVLA